MQLTARTDPWRWIVVLVPCLLLWFIPIAGLTPAQSHLLAIFAATIVALVAQPVPMGVSVLVAITLLALTRTLTPAQALSGFSNVTVWQRAIPHYNLGHTARLASLESTRSKYPGLWFAGNYLTGPAVGTCVEQAAKVADEVRVSFAN